jgi:hypothetical protein
MSACRIGTYFFHWRWGSTPSATYR